MPELEVLFEDNHLLVVNKPPGPATMGARAGQMSVLEYAKKYVKRKYDKPGNVYLGIVSRLDAPVSGVLLLARTSKAASRLSSQFRSGQIGKTYWALVAGCPRPAQDTLQDWIVKDEKRRRMRVVSNGHPGAKRAALEYCSGSSQRQATFLTVRLITGRKHQIRVQLSQIGHPILGDRKYGSSTGFPLGIALHARHLAFHHPVSQKLCEMFAPLPKSWDGYGVEDTSD